jgi:hypothetical protein
MQQQENCQQHLAAAATKQLVLAGLLTLQASAVAMKACCSCSSSRCWSLSSMQVHTPRQHTLAQRSTAMLQQHSSPQHPCSMKQADPGRHLQATSTGDCFHNQGRMGCLSNC